MCFCDPNLINLAIPAETGCLDDCEGVKVTEEDAILGVLVTGVKDTDPDFVISNDGLDNSEALPDLARLVIRDCAQLSFASAIICGIMELDDDVKFDGFPSSSEVDCLTEFKSGVLLDFGKAGVKLMEGGSCLIIAADCNSDFEMAVN